MAFAYFAVNPDYKKVGHDTGFYGLFDGKENVSIYKSKHLSNGFPIDAVKSEFAVTKTEKTKQVSYHMTAKKVYAVAKACVEAGLFKFPLNEYEFLDQNDAFTLLIKDESLMHVNKALKLGLTKIDSLSAVDVFSVKKTSKQKIINEFKKAFGSDTKIVENAILANGNDYTAITSKYMDSGELLPISLKLPNTLVRPPNVKRIQLSKTGLVKMDPFVKMVSIILDEPSKTKEIIDKVVEIEFEKFRTHEVLNWVFPVFFRYENLIDPETKKPIEKYSLRFNLFAQGHGAGWNGQFDVSTNIHKDTQWVGGVSTGTFEQYANHYPEYKGVMRDLVALRAKAFDDVTRNMDDGTNSGSKKDPSLKHKAETDLKKNMILNTSQELKNLVAFFGDPKDNKEPKKLSPLHQYKLAVIRSINKNSKDYSGDIEKQQELIDAHFVHAQISYFMMQSETNLYFKQRLFFTIFGLITKMSHRIVDIDDYKGMRNAIQSEILKDGKKALLEFSTPPHYLIS